MDVEGKVMSLRFISSLTTARRVAIGTALAASLGLTALATADERVTALLRGGERVTGRFDGIANGLVHIDVSDTDERKIPLGDVALIDLVGGAQGLPETELSEARGDDHVLFPKSGGPVKGRLVTIEGSEREKNNPQPTTVVFRTSSGEERRLRLSEVGRLYLGRYPGAAPAGTSTSNPTATPATAGGQNGTVNVPANQRWVSTGITVSAGQMVSFNASGEVQLSADAGDTATTAGSKLGRRASGAPLPAELAGALVGRVGNGRVFGIGNQAGPLTMPDGGMLYLAVNDDNVDDNRGAFSVTVTAQPFTGTSRVNPRDPRRRP
jgi:hypothetical protein